MTYILSLTTPFYIQQASDRLTTRTAPELRNYDLAANKSVVFHGIDGYAAFGYSGIAYLNSLPTDHFIAKTLAEVEIPNPPPGVMGRGPAGHAKIGDCVHHLKHALDAAFQKLSPLDRAIGINVLATGWRFRRRAHLLFKFSTFKWELFNVAERIHIERVPLACAGLLHLTAQPRNTLTKADADRLLHDLYRIVPDCEQTAAILASEIRRVSDNFALRGARTVSRDCMTVTLLPPNPGCIAIARYVPDPDIGQPPEDDYPSFCPWVISENVIVAPLALGPGWTGPFGVGEFRLDGPEGGQLGFHSQHRMPPPKRLAEAAGTQREPQHS